MLNSSAWSCVSIRIARPSGRLRSVRLLPMHKSAGCPIVRSSQPITFTRSKGDKEEWLCSQPTQSRISGNRFMPTSEDNILNGFCQTANLQCAMLTRRGSWRNFPNWRSDSQTRADRMATHRKLDESRVYLCAANSLALMRPKEIRETLSLGIYEIKIGGRRFFFPRAPPFRERCRNHMKGRLTAQRQH